jgi:Cu+-exporting ATPase
VNEYGEHWTDKKIADEVEDVGFDAEIVEKSEVAHIELRVYGYVYHKRGESSADD